MSTVMKRRTKLILQLGKRQCTSDDGGRNSSRNEWHIMRQNGNGLVEASARASSNDKKGDVPPGSHQYTLDWLEKLPDVLVPLQPTDVSQLDKTEFSEFAQTNGSAMEVPSTLVELQPTQVSQHDKTESELNETGRSAVEVPNALVELQTMQASQHDKTESTNLDETKVTENTEYSGKSPNCPLLDEPRDPFYVSDDEEADPSYIPEVEKTPENANLLVNLNDEPQHLKTKNCRKENLRLIAKKNKAFGKEYVNRVKKIVPQKVLKPPCANCKFKCAEKIEETQRQALFDSYWALGDLQRQRQFIKDSMEKVKPQTQRVTVNKTRDRGQNQAFYVTVSGAKTRVCKQFFKSTYDVTDRTIRTVVEKTQNDTGVLDIDYRGKHKQHKRLDSELVESVHNHIKRIPHIPSHYCRQKTTRVYIEGGKTVAELHRDYEDERKEKGKKSADYKQYYKIFKTYNLSFFKPKKDLCEECVAFENSSPDEQAKLKEIYEAHITNKDRARIEKSNDKEKSPNSTVVAVYDLQAVLPCPQGTASPFYYVSKIAVYNLTVTDIKQNKTVCYTWHEGEGHRGVIEIATCIYKYLEEINERAKERKENTDVIFYTDNCSGQQKNKFMKSMYRYVVQNCEFIASITHKFLIRGHTQNEGDGAHARIEIEVQNALRNGPLFVPSQYYTIMRQAKKTGCKYEVKELCHSDFLDWKQIPVFSSVKISEICAFKLLKNDSRIYFKKAFDDDWSMMEEHTKRKKLEKIEKPKPAYSRKLRMKPSKKNPLLGLLEKRIIPAAYSDFYNNL